MTAAWTDPHTADCPICEPAAATWAAAQLATLQAHVDPNPPHVRPLTSAQLAAIDAAESLAEDRAFFGWYGGTDREADHAALVEENRSGRQVASALDWLERGGVR